MKQQLDRRKRHVEEVKRLWAVAEAAGGVLYRKDNLTGLQDALSDLYHENFPDQEQRFNPSRGDV